MATDDETRKHIEELIEAADPSVVEKYGNPLDKDDPRNWTPSSRAEKGVSLEDQVKFLALDMERQIVLNEIMLKELRRLEEWVAEQQKKEFIQLLETNPEKAADQLIDMLKGSLPKSYGPLDNSPDAAVKYAGSTKGIKPDQMVETPQGWILGKDIPGYREDPNWEPSPDWKQANCMCPVHKAERELATHKPDDDFPTGFYL